MQGKVVLLGSTVNPLERLLVNINYIKKSCVFRCKTLCECVVFTSDCVFD